MTENFLLQVALQYAEELQADLVANDTEETNPAGFDVQE